MILLLILAMLCLLGVGIIIGVSWQRHQDRLDKLNNKPLAKTEKRSYDNSVWVMESLISSGLSGSWKDMRGK